jgi:hypothetical protein
LIQAEAGTAIPDHEQMNLKYEFFIAANPGDAQSLWIVVQSIVFLMPTDDNSDVVQMCGHRGKL